MRRMGSLISAIALTMAGSMAYPAAAVDISRQDFQGAAGMCKGATPAFNNALHISPLGMANDSAATVYITCNFQGDDTQNGARGARNISASFVNTSTGSRSIACTLVNGFQSGSTTVATYTPKTLVLAAGATASLAWVPGDIAGAPDQIKLPALSCGLPSGTTLQFTAKQYNEDVGA